MQQFDEVYNILTEEKKQVDSNVKVYLGSDPSYEKSYVRSSVIDNQNVYTSLRAEIKTEYTIYDVAVNGENKMTFNSEDEANKYASDLKGKVAKLNIQVTTEKVADVGDMTTVERADTILKDIVSRNQPLIPTNTIKTNTNKTTNNNSSSVGVNTAFSNGGIWPTTSRYVSSRYGWRSDIGDFHTGTDIAGKSGDPIYAYKDGVVVFAGWGGSYGNLVKIDHGNGIQTWYAHNSKILVSVGQSVSQGETVSLMGRTGFATGNHLHFEVRLNGAAVDSYKYIVGK